MAHSFPFRRRKGENEDALSPNFIKYEYTNDGC